MKQSRLTPEAAELIARRFRALSDPTRLRILDLLRRQDEASVGEIAELVGGSQQNVSKHLGALHAEGFVSRRKRGTSSIYRITDPGVHQICDGISAGIEAQLAEMEAVALRLSRPGPQRTTRNAPDRIRTCDLRFRRPTLYPTELRARVEASMASRGILWGAAWACSRDQRPLNSAWPGPLSRKVLTARCRSSVAKSSPASSRTARSAAGTPPSR